jgi:hypothetical protein
VEGSGGDAELGVRGCRDAVMVIEEVEGGGTVVNRWWVAVLRTGLVGRLTLKEDDELTGNTTSI